MCRNVAAPVAGANSCQQNHRNYIQNKHLQQKKACLGSLGDILSQTPKQAFLILKS